MIKFASALVLMLTLPAVLSAAAAQSVTPVSITLSDYAFTPSALNLKAGTTYQLHFVNSGSKGHDFSAPEFFAASQLAAEDQAKVNKGLVELESGQSADITVTPGQAGTYPIACTHFMHVRFQFFDQRVVRGNGHHRHFFGDQSKRPVFQFSSRVRFGMDV